MFIRKYLWRILSIILLAVCLGTLVLLSTKPVFEIGNTAITDLVFLWGIEGLSIWSNSLARTMLSLLQLLAFSLAIIFIVIALITHSRWRLRFVWTATISSTLAAIFTYAHGKIIAPSSADLIPLLGFLDGPALTVYLLLFLVLDGIVEMRLLKSLAY